MTKIAISETSQYELFEEAFLIYTKVGKKSEGETKTAMHVCAAEVGLASGRLRAQIEPRGQIVTQFTVGTTIF